MTDRSSYVSRSSPGFPILAACVLILACGWPDGPAAAGGWPQWRGPDRDGHADDFAGPRAWPEQLQRVWSVDVGAGVASPVAIGDRIWVLSRDGDREVVTCLAASDGQRLWSQRYDAPFVPNAQAVSPRRFPASRGAGPFATPLVVDGRLFTLGVTRVLSAFDAQSGERLWHRDFLPVELPKTLVWRCPPCNRECDKREFAESGQCPDCRMQLTAEGLETTAINDGSRGNYYGACSSPLAAERLGVVQVGNPAKSLLIAFDRDTGRERWRRESKPIASSSPVVATLGGVAQVVTLTRESVEGVALADGAPLWTHPLGSNAQIVTPVVFEDLVVFGEYRGPATAVRVARDGAQWTVEPAWQSDALKLYMTTPVRIGDTLYGLSSTRKGQFVALDARSGELRWASEGRDAEYASIVAVGETLLATTTAGELMVFRDGTDAAGAPRFELLRRYEVADSPIWAHPALWDGRILVRDEQQLTLWRAAASR